MSESLFDAILDRDAINSVNRKPYGRAPAFDGSTFDVQQDFKRLSGQLARVYNCMRDGEWRTLNEIKSYMLIDSEAGISARLRDLRKSKWGSHTVNRRRREDSNGLFEYQLIVNKEQVTN